MANTELKPEEKKTLIGQFIGLMLLSLLVLGWSIYVFIVVLRLNFMMMKKMFLSNPETLAYVFVPLILIIVGVLPRAARLWKDVSTNTVEEGIASIATVKRSWLSRDWFVSLNVPGKEKIRMLRKDIYQLTPGKKIKFRITTSSKLLIGFEILNGK